MHTSQQPQMYLFTRPDGTREPVSRATRNGRIRRVRELLAQCPRMAGKLTLADYKARFTPVPGTES